MTSGWFLTRSGRNELSRTKEAPKDVFDMIVRIAPRIYVSFPMKR
jgi:hypothetical protein